MPSHYIYAECIDFIRWKSRVEGGGRGRTPSLLKMCIFFRLPIQLLPNLFSETTVSCASGEKDPSFKRSRKSGTYCPYSTRPFPLSSRLQGWAYLFLLFWSLPGQIIQLKPGLHSHSHGQGCQCVLVHLLFMVAVGLSISLIFNGLVDSFSFRTFPLIATCTCGQVLYQTTDTPCVRSQSNIFTILSSSSNYLNQIT